MHLTLRQLQYFVATAKAGSITRAAELMHVAPTALSLQIKAIEDRFGIVLLDRHSRGITMTPRGADLFERAQAIILQVRDAEAALSNGAQEMPRLIRLGAPPAIARLIGTEAVLGVAGRFPNLTIDVLQGWSASLQDRLRNGELDVIVGFDLMSDEKIRAVQIHEEEFVVAGAPGVAGPAEPISLAEVVAAKLVFYGAKSVGWRSVCEAAALAGLAAPRESQVGSIDVWRGILCKGAGCTITSFTAIAEEHARGQIIARPIIGRPIRRQIGIAFRTADDKADWQDSFCAFIEELILRALLLLEVRIAS